jgi:hypothetical protein
MPDVIEVSAQINVYHPRQPLQYPSRYSVYRLMGMTSRPVPIGALPEVQCLGNVDSYSALVIFRSTHPYGLGAVDAGRIHPKISGDISTRNRG